MRNSVRLKEVLEAEMERVLEEFPELFKETTGLPPSRTRDHRSSTAWGGAGVLQPYRYGQTQRVEMGHLVAEMLVA